ncbi:hypothetical protein A6E15_18435 [Natrinema saccharevitans]|uniref:Uncharacterized protein n=1 Tax=Natrinema saccharevitans TaxID=301967 RepID=A0A1S8AS18_9EURY|nr:hypothetical protein A6E15_18435 [Natrinema saccharevitans]
MLVHWEIQSRLLALRLLLVALFHRGELFAFAYDLNSIVHLLECRSRFVGSLEFGVLLLSLFDVDVRFLEVPKLFEGICPVLHYPITLWTITRVRR